MALNAPVRPARTLLNVVVERVELVTPHMKRIRVDGSGLSDYRVGLPAQWLKVVVPTIDGQSKAARAYTVRRFDPASKKLDLDFVLHGDDGPASAWAARAKVGDAFEISVTHPRSGFPIQPSIKHYLLFGDETALPAIGAIIESLPTDARANVLVEIADAEEEQSIESGAAVDLIWLHRNAGGGASLEKAAKSVARPGEDAVVWVAAESSVVKAIRKHALVDWGVDRSRLHAAGYWKRGEADHRDEEVVV